jgi:hypothetical protein
MGVVKSMRDLQKVTKQMDRTWDPAAQRKAGMARMAGIQDMMAQATNAANTAATGVDATATVAAVAQTGAMINMEPVVELALTVIPASGLAPYPATIRQPVSQLHLPQVRVGSTLHVKVDAGDPQSIWINFAAGAA